MSSSRKRKYEVWFDGDPAYMVLRESTLLSLIKRRTFVHTPILRYRRVEGGGAA